jgi:hypothetical protein
VPGARDLDAPHARRDHFLQGGRAVVDHRRRVHLDADRERV